ncbi:MAG: LysR family transcriptional regulator [Alphaproteobacteria bacterium]
MRLDLQTLKLFVAVYEERSLAKAAEREHLAASAVSKRLADLEHELRVKLFERTRSGMQPTSAGHALIIHARRVLHNLTQLEAELVDFASGLRGTLRVFANTSAMVQYLPDDLKSFLGRHPLVRVEIEEATSQATIHAVAESNAEIGIYGDVIQAAHLESMLYREDRLCLLVPEDHPLAEERSIRFALALDHAFIGTPRGSSIDIAITEAANALDRQVTLRMRAGGFEAISRMVDAGLGVALVPDSLARSYVGVRRVRAVTLDEPWVARRLMLCMRSRDSLSPAAAAFVDYLVGKER